mmetsp:Transcript_40530/g.116021  ORF Transcript_40530/g.116021 Transcript_40530/m.116021 type:complete len:328 (+) Transcript_40530:267-1250(+)
MEKRGAQARPGVRAALRNLRPMCSLLSCHHDGVQLVCQRLQHLPGVAGQAREALRPGRHPADLVAKQQRRGREVGGRVPGQRIVRQRRFQQLGRRILARLRLLPVLGLLLRRAEPPVRRAADGGEVHQDVERGGAHDLETEPGQDVKLLLHHLLPGVGISSVIDEVLDVGRLDLLELGRDQERGHAYELQLALADLDQGEVAVDDVDSQEYSFPTEPQLLAQLGKPIHQRGAVLRGDVRLRPHEAPLRRVLRLSRQHLLQHVHRVLPRGLGVLAGLRRRDGGEAARGRGAAARTRQREHFPPCERGAPDGHGGWQSARASRHGALKR